MRRHAYNIFFFFFALKGILLQHDSRIIVAVDILFIFFC